MICTPQWILVFTMLLLRAHHGNKVCTQQTQKKGAMNSCTHTSSLTMKCLSAPSDQLLAPRRPLNTAAVRGCRWREGRCGFISEDSVSFWCAVATRQRGFMTLEMLLSVQLTQELTECLKVIKVWLLWCSWVSDLSCYYNALKSLLSRTVSKMHTVKNISFLLHLAEVLWHSTSTADWE